MFRLIKIFIVLLCFFFADFAYCNSEMDDVAKQLNTYMQKLTNLKARCAHISNNKVREGTICFIKSKSPKLMIRYEIGHGQKQEFLIKKGWLYVFDIAKQKVISNKKLAGDPLYEILTGEFDFSKQKFNHIFEKGVLHVNLFRKGFKFPPLILHFSYKNEKVVNLIGWTVNDGKNIAELIIDEESIRINSPSVPDLEFEFTKVE